MQTSKLLTHTQLLTTLLTALTLPVCAQEKDAAKSGGTSSGSSVSIVNGQATVTTEVNGKKETKTFDVGKNGSVTVTDGVINVRDMSVPAKPVTWLGVATQETDDTVTAQLLLDKGTGLTVHSVAPGSPAAKAGLQENDVLTRFDQQILVNPEQLEVLVHARKEGTPVEITFFRKGQETKATVTLASRTPEQIQPGLGGNTRLHDMQKSVRNLLDLNDPKNPVAAGVKKFMGNAIQLPDLEDLLKDAKKAGPMTYKKTIVIGPDGKVTEVEDNNPGDSLDSILEQLNKAGLSKEAREAVEKALRATEKKPEAAPVK